MPEFFPSTVPDLMALVSWVALVFAAYYTGKAQGMQQCSRLYKNAMRATVNRQADLIKELEKIRAAIHNADRP